MNKLDKYGYAVIECKDVRETFARVSIWDMGIICAADAYTRYGWGWGLACETTVHACIITDGLEAVAVHVAYNAHDDCYVCEADALDGQGRPDGLRWQGADNGARGALACAQADALKNA